MALAQMQAALARLCTDASARAELRTDPAAFAARWELSAEEGDALALQVLGEVEAVARSLRQKRRSEASRAMPLAVQVLGPRFRPLFHEYAEATPLTHIRNPALDALAFLQRLLAASGEALSIGDRDALGYEAGSLIMQQTGRRFLARWLLVPGSGTASRSLAVWWRWRGQLRHWLIR